MISRQRRSQLKYPERQRARRAAQRALKTGRFKSRRCEVCGALPSEMHHPDYSEPLKVVFLCKRHHVVADLRDHPDTPRGRPRDAPRRPRIFKVPGVQVSVDRELVDKAMKATAGKYLTASALVRGLLAEASLPAATTPTVAERLQT